MIDDPLDIGRPLNERGFIPAFRESRFAVGVDLGQAADPTAICITERIREPVAEIPEDLVQKLGAPRYECRYLERLPLGVSYVSVIGHVRNLLARAPLNGNARLVLDRSGVGRGVSDLFVHAGLNPVAVTITGGGDNEHREEDGSGWRVSKLSLVSKLQAILHTGELKIARSLPEASTLALELQNFRASISDSGYASFGARVGRHDDLVLSVALAVWYLAGPRGSRWSVQPFEL